MNVRILGLATIAAALLLSEQFALAQRPKSDAEEQLTTRVYQLADMILPLPNHAYRPEDLPATPAGASANVGGSRQFGGGGGAAFNVQIGEFGGGRAGEASGGAGGGGFGTPAGVDNDATALAMDQIAELIESTVEPTSWSSVGGSGSITSYRSLLVVSQTAANHTKIESTLNMLREVTGTLRTVTISAHWLLLDSDQLAKLQVERDGRLSIDREQLAKFTRDASSYRGQITCFSGQTVHVVGGQRRNVVTGLTPVIGGEASVGYQPRGGLPNLGVLLQVQPTLVAGADAAIVDLESWVTSSSNKERESTFEFQSSQPATGQDAAADGKGDAASGGTNVRVDRLNIASQSLATTLRAPVGVPVLAGGLTAVPEVEGESGESKQLYLVLQVNVVDDAPRAETKPQPLRR